MQARDLIVVQERVMLRLRKHLRAHYVAFKSSEPRGCYRLFERDLGRIPNTHERAEVVHMLAILANEMPSWIHADKNK
jgi:hypothetical protein